MMTKDVIDELNKESLDLSPFHQKMLNEARGLVKQSRSRMSKHYPRWDMNDMVYRGERAADKDDVEQSVKGNPAKAVVPNTYAQVMTFVSFLFLQFKQNNNLFELDPTSASAYGQLQDDCEVVLARDMRYNSEARLVFQYLKDIGVFGVGVMENSWIKKVSKIYAPQETETANVAGVDVTPTPSSDWQTVTKYEGNLVRNVSPYRFFPDLRGRSIGEFQKGEFCAAEEEYSKGELFELEKVGEVAGIKWLRPFDSESVRSRAEISRLSFDATHQRYGEQWANTGSKTAPVVVTKMQRWLVPDQYYTEGDEDTNGKTLGDEDFPVLYHVWYANDNRLIRVEPCQYWHNEFSWTVSEFTPDMQRDVNLSLASLIGPLQDVISWLFNSRIRDTRRNIFGRFIVDPRVIDTKTLDGEGDIYLRKGMSTDISRGIAPVPQNNVTQGHMQDAQTITGIMQLVTGVNDNMQGAVNGGRRSAREVSQAGAGAAGRMKMHGQLIWESGFGRLGRLMLSNLRQSLTAESFTAVMGRDDPAQADDPKYKTLEQRFADFQSDPATIAMGGDFFIFDSTTQSEKGFLANALQELLGIILQNPQAALTLDVDPKALSDEIQLLRGTGPMKRFSTDGKAQYQQTLMQQAALTQQANAPAQNGPPPTKA